MKKYAQKRKRKKEESDFEGGYSLIYFLAGFPQALIHKKYYNISIFILKAALIPKVL